MNIQVGLGEAQTAEYRETVKNTGYLLLLFDQ